MVITRPIAEKLFGHTDILGESILLSGVSAPVSSVIDEMPENSSLKADLFINSSTGIRFSTTNRNGSQITFNPYPIYVRLQDGTNVASLEERINSSFPANHSDTKCITFQPLSDIYFDKTVIDNPNIPGNRTMVLVFISIAAIILILSVINYINYTLSRQLDTLKQLGVKKAYGASFRQLRIYYILEIGLSVFLSFVLSVVIGFITLPFFQGVLGVHLDMRNFFTPVFLFSVVSILALVIVISSLTPFYVISKFDVQMLFGKKQTYMGKQRGKVFLSGCQMALTVILFVCLFMLHKQMNFMKNYDLGFDKELLVRMDTPNQTSNEAFRNEISQYSFVQSFTSSLHSPGFMTASEGQNREQDGKTIKILKIITEPGFLETFDLELLTGRNFTDADREKSCIVNEETMYQLGWEDIEGKRCNGYQVIGVVKNFNVSSLHNRIEPVNIIPHEKEILATGPVHVRLQGNIRDGLSQLHAAWQKVYPGFPFSYRFYNEVFDSYYRKEEKQTSAIAIISILAIIITCMGLIGQVKQTIISKAKEIGVRKINGATETELVFLILKKYLFSFAVAFLVAIPIAWYALETWLQNFAFQAPISWWVFPLSGVVVLLILMSFVIYQTWRAATVNPLDAIKSE